MPFDRATLQAAIAASGGATQPPDQVERLLAKLEMLEATGRYSALLKGVAKANDKSNFLALLLEATFAYQFEAAGIALDYEVKQDATDGTSIDFGMKLDDGRVAYFELRLLQQDHATSESIAEQLTMTEAYAAAMNGEEEQKAVLKVQSTVLSKVEDKHGKPVKFLKTDASVVNIVVVCISDILLGTADLYDCLLATYGDPEVPPECRRDVFGLFQELKAAYPEAIQKAAARFAHLKATVHAVLFLFRPADSGVLDYSLKQVLVWNRGISTAESARPVCERVFAALPALK
jgi:hypothetical protein